MPSPIGHIRNRAATKGDVAAPSAPGAMLRAPEGFAALDEALTEMAAAGVRTLVIEGGDGTVREIVSRAPEIWGAAPPAYAILRRGNTNLIARTTGSIDRAGLERLAEGGAAKSVTLSPLRVRRTGERVLRGFIMGAGAYETATRFAQEEIGARHGPQVLLAVLRLLRSEALRRPTPIGFATDGDVDPEVEPRTLVGLSTLPGSLLYGLEPFWGEGEGPIRWLDVAGDPPRLALAAAFVALGRPRSWMRERYRSGRTAAAAMRLATPFVMDGERFDAPSDGLLRIDASETATFLSG